MQKKGLIVKFMVNQVAFSLLGIFVTSAVFNLQNHILLLAGLFSSIFFFFLIYSNAFDEGQRDAIKVEGNRMKMLPLLGFYYTLVAYFPTIIIVILNLCFRLFFSGVSIIEKISYLIDAFFVRIFSMGMYLGIELFIKYSSKTGELLSGKGALFAIFLLFAPVVSGAGYFCGLHNFKLLRKPQNKKV